MHEWTPFYYSYLSIGVEKKKTINTKSKGIYWYTIGSFFFIENCLVVFETINFGWTNLGLSILIKYQRYTLNLLHLFIYIICIICGNHFNIKVILISSNFLLLQYNYNMFSCCQLYTKNFLEKVGFPKFSGNFSIFFP